MRFDISWVLAGSPRYLLFGPKPTRDLRKVSYFGIGCRLGDLRCSSIRDFICDLSSLALYQPQAVETTYHVDTSVPRDSDDGILRTEIYTHDTHDGGGRAG